MASLHIIQVLINAHPVKCIVCHHNIYSWHFNKHHARIDLTHAVDDENLVNCFKSTEQPIVTNIKVAIGKLESLAISLISKLLSFTVVILALTSNLQHHTESVY